MYTFCHYTEYDYSILKRIKVNKYRGKGARGSYNNAIIMFDTETSKTGPVEYAADGTVIPQTNIIVAFTVSIRYRGENYCTLYGNRPSELMQCLQMIRDAVKGTLFIYCFNLGFDWLFLRKFFFRSFGYPVKQLNIKAHKPILFKFDNDIIIKDAYVLAGRKLSKWAEDLNVEHQKAVGSWDYDLIRTQEHIFTPEELHYIECDTLAGIECLEVTMKMLNKNISSIPYTVTGIIREEVRTEGKEHNAHNDFLRTVPDLDTQIKLEYAFHGGYTHGNRYYYGEYFTDQEIEARDFASSYPFIMLAYKLPSSRFVKLDGHYSITDILNDSDDYAFLFKLVAIGVSLKDYTAPMPYLQFSKCKKIINPVLDNGRVISCDYCEIYLTEYDLMILNDLYNFESHACTEVEYSIKRYMPRWYTDIVYRLFYDKSTLKGKDPTLYMLQKGKLNSLYGNCVTKPCRLTTEECFETGEYIDKEFDQISEYNKYINKRKSVLNYAWGVWITSIAAYNLFRLGSCVDYDNGGLWLYSDTDSAYSNKWDNEKIEAYNADCRRRLKDNGYNPVIYEGKEYCPGVAALDGTYTEFCYLGAKRYAGRDADTGKLKITVAGVPKKTGAKCLEDDIHNFKMGFCFAGSITGKLQHSYIYVDEIYTDDKCNEVGDSIDLNACSYILDQEQLFDFDDYVEVTEDGQSNFR